MIYFLSYCFPHIACGDFSLSFFSLLYYPSLPSIPPSSLILTLSIFSLFLLYVEFFKSDSSLKNKNSELILWITCIASWLPNMQSLLSLECKIQYLWIVFNSSPVPLSAVFLPSFLFLFVLLSFTLHLYLLVLFFFSKYLKTAWNHLYTWVGLVQSWASVRGTDEGYFCWLLGLWKSHRSVGHFSLEWFLCLEKNSFLSCLKESCCWCCGRWTWRKEPGVLFQHEALT